jgi:hypothetical protein
MSNYCLVLPFLPGGLEFARKFANEHGVHNKEHDGFYKIAGITRENVWIQRSPPGSGSPDLEIVSLETKDATNMLKEFATKAYGIDFSGPMPSLNENIIDWNEE